MKAFILKPLKLFGGGLGLIFVGMLWLAFWALLIYLVLIGLGGFNLS